MTFDVNRVPREGRFLCGIIDRAQEVEVFGVGKGHKFGVEDFEGSCIVTGNCKRARGNFVEVTDAIKGHGDSE